MIVDPTRGSGRIGSGEKLYRKGRVGSGRVQFGQKLKFKLTLKCFGICILFCILACSVPAVYLLFSISRVVFSVYRVGQKKPDCF